LPGRFTTKKLFGWSDKRYNKEHWGRLEQNWKQWKGRRRRQILETIKKEKEIKQKKPEIRKWTEEDKKKMGNIVDLYYEL